MARLGVLGTAPSPHRQELKFGQSRPTPRSPGNLFGRRPVTAVTVIAAIFWMKTRAQWKETSVTELAVHR
jgi:hypothetical protein